MRVSQIHFFSDTIIPLAIQTNALILLGQSLCEISTVFAMLCSKLQAQRGGELPFTVMTICIGVFHIEAAGRSGSVANQFQNLCDRWKGDAKKISMAAYPNGAPPLVKQECQ